MTFHIKRRETLEEALRRIAHEQIDHVFMDFDDEEMSVDGRVHSLRARCKKIRALLKLPGPLMGDIAKAEDDRIRDCGQRLARIRDAHVQAATAAELLGREIEAPVAPAQDHAADIERSLKDLRDVRAAIDDWPLPVRGFCDIAPGFARTYRKCLHAWRLAREEPRDEYFHRLRKWSKYHWYQVRMLERLDTRVMKKRRARLRQLGRILGDAHDLVVLTAVLQGVEPADDRLLRRAARRKSRLYRDAVAIGEQVYRPTADDLTAVLSDGWAAWRQ